MRGKITLQTRKNKDKRFKYLIENSMTMLLSDIPIDSDAIIIEASFPQYGGIEYWYSKESAEKLKISTIDETDYSVVIDSQLLLDEKQAIIRNKKSISNLGYEPLKIKVRW